MHAVIRPPIRKFAAETAKGLLAIVTCAHRDWAEPVMEIAFILSKIALALKGQAK